MTPRRIVCPGIFKPKQQFCKLCGGLKSSHQVKNGGKPYEDDGPGLPYESKNLFSRKY